jgi:enoyl-CoA hydratase/carnithine racemase
MLADMKNQVADTCQAQQNERLRRLILDLQDTVSTIARCSKPVIAAIHGACVGGGLDIASACDIRYAATGSKFSIKEVDLAIVADLGSLQRLPRIISPAQVAELAFTGRALSAEEALQAGLISKVLESEEALLTYTREVASIIAAKSPLTIRGIKQVLAYSLTHSIEEGLQHVATWNSATLLSADLQEAVTAQIQKRSPQFR